MISIQNILFVCSANKDRSKTADDLFSDLYPNLKFDSGGSNLKLCQRIGTTPLQKEQIDWADLVFVMEKKHLAKVRELSSSNSKSRLINLNIPDRFKYYQEELIHLLKEKVKPHLEGR